jgi:hypothetical protein
MPSADFCGAVREDSFRPHLAVTPWRFACPSAPRTPGREGEAVGTAYPIAEAIAEKVTFVSGASFFADGSGHNTFHLNFSNVMPGHMEAGMRRLGGMLSRRA